MKELNLFALEKQLIDWEKLKKIKEHLPVYCQRLLDMTPDELGGSTGIGRNEELGWFVMGCGQGPCLLWTEIKIIEDN